MPISQGFLFNTAATGPSDSRPCSSGSNQKKARTSRSQCNTPIQGPSKQPQGSTTPPESRYDGRLSPGETRQELIERKKREQRATWLTDNKHGSYGSHSQPPASDRNDHGSEKPDSSSLLPPLDVTTRPRSPKKHEDQTHSNAAASIERPRSALHRGDFRQDINDQGADALQPGSPYPRGASSRQEWFSTSPTSPWFQPQLQIIPGLARHETFPGFESRTESKSRPGRQRAVSYTSRSSIALQPPTSPLVNESNNNSDSDNDHARSGRTKSPDKAARRRTFSPGALTSIRPSPLSHGLSPTVPRALPNVRRDGSLPYQAHQPRRSVTSSNDFLPYSLPQTPSAHSRRPSLASESSPLQRAPMVGRYEESILRGRMSSLPSRPLDFVAQIGVLGKGNCKASLRCPPHVTVPFPAVFYHYGSRPGSPSKSEEGPSPYVGVVDLNTVYQSPNAPHSKPGLHETKSTLTTKDSTELAPDAYDSINFRKRPRSGSHSSKSSQPVSGYGYRIPEKGQLQIIIKNPNKTAVKLFLVPYDLGGMQPGQKTFIRQRSYSAGPIIDMPLTARKNFGTDRPEAAISNSDDPKDRPVLRYLIHLNICCPSKGRFFLYKSIRVVFANRVPDGKEKLRQEIQLPEPRFSSWKPDKEKLDSKNDSQNVGQGHQVSHSSSYQPAVARRRPGLDQIDGFTSSFSHTNDHQNRLFTFPIHHPVPILPTPKPPSRDGTGDSRMDTPPSPLSSRGSIRTFRGCESSSPKLSSPPQPRFNRLSREEYTIDGSGRRPQSPRPGEGLLALQFKDLAGSRPPSQGN